MTNQSSGKNIISPNTLDQKSLNIQGPAYIAKIQKTAVFLLIFTSIINGLGVVSMSMALQYTTPVYFIALRFLLGALVLIAVFHKKLLKSSKETIKAGAILGIFIITSVSIQSISLQYTTAGKASFISSLYVVLVAIFSWVSSRKINFLQIGMVLLTIIGLAVFSLEKDMAANKGDLLNIITAFIYSGHFIFLSHFAQKHELMTLVTWQVIFSAIGSPLVHIFRHGR
ncbi:MAG: DMT family transporter, partial [Clostridiales bacterium]